MADKYDLVVVGAGPGGYVAAIRGSQLGLRTAVVERERPGGICLNWGCIPTKALLNRPRRCACASTRDRRRHRGKIGFDWNKVIARSRAAADKMAKGIESLFRKYRVDLFPGVASFKGRGKLEVAGPGGKSNLDAKRVIVATGARAKFLPGIEPDGSGSSPPPGGEVLPELPSSVVVIGAGAIGVEFADFERASGPR